jgi:hypothetical protein
MPRPPKLRPDVNETAFRIVQAATGEGAKPLPPAERVEKNPDAVNRGRLGGNKGGKARAQKLSKRQRSQISQGAARARWKRPTK